jgi:hypothetical protein
MTEGNVIEATIAGASIESEVEALEESKVVEAPNRGSLDKVISIVTYEVDVVVQDQGGL